MANRENNTTSPSSKSNQIATDADQTIKESEFIGSTRVPYGVLNIDRHSAHDHASMRASQLSNLLLLIQADDCISFRSLGGGSQSSLMWLATQLADELVDLVKMVGDDNRTGATA